MSIGWLVLGWARYPDPVGQGLSLVLFAALLALSAIDLDRFILPDAVTLPLVLFGFGVSWLYQGSLASSLIGAALGYGLVAGLAAAWRRYRRQEAIGLGDAKLLAAGGALLGAFHLPLILLLSSSMALVWVLLTQLFKTRRDDLTYLPFGPFLCLSIWFFWLAPKSLLLL